VAPQGHHPEVLTNHIRKGNRTVPAHIWLAVGLLTASLPLLVWAVFSRPTPARLKALVNLRRGVQAPDDPDHPAAAGQGGAVRRSLALRLVPAGMLRQLDRLAARAGRPAAWPLERLVSAKIMLGLGAAVLGVLCTVSTGRTGAGALAAAVTVIAFFVPELLLYSRGQKRRETIALELADTLDQMTIAVEAGLGFESAMAQAGRNGNGPLAEELVRTLQDIEMGRSRRQAYESLASRTDVDDLGRFTRAVIQADAHGISIANVLRTQAAEMRIKRRQRAEEKAMQIPVKVVFPLLLCILPVLFIVLLAPAAMDVARAFS
jgi:tight adherence protein C